MKKSRIFMSLGALALVIAGVVSTKASKKFSFSGTIYYSPTTLTDIIAGSGCSSGFSLITNGTVKAHFVNYTLYGYNQFNALQTLYYQ